MYLRAMGTKVGAGVACMGGVVAEYEQVVIGEGTVVNEGTFILTHTVENRCAKIRPISIGKRVTVGGLCAVLPDAAVEDGSSLADMSLVSEGSFTDLVSSNDEHHAHQSLSCSDKVCPVQCCNIVVSLRLAWCRQPAPCLMSGKCCAAV
jgi:hypothetical protein